MDVRRFITLKDDHMEVCHFMIIKDGHMEVHRFMTIKEGHQEEYRSTVIREGHWWVGDTPGDKSHFHRGNQQRGRNQSGDQIIIHHLRHLKMFQ